MTLIEQHISEIRALCKKHHVKALYAFGSVVNEEDFRENSDVDLIVKLDESVVIEDYADIYFELVEEFEILFKRKVDLLLDNPIRNKYLRSSIEASKQQIYAAA